MLNIIVAPKEHNSKGEKITKKIVRYLKSEKVEYSVYFSTNFNQLRENVQEVLAVGETELVVVGDDIVLSTVLSSIKDLNKVKIGIVPTSKSDDFAKYLGISSSPIQAVKEIMLKNIANIDLLVVNDMPVLNCLIIGAGVEIYHQYSQYKLKNILTEKFASLKYGNNFPGIELLLENKGKSKKENIFELIVANGGLSKGRVVSPLSNVQDGLFNVSYSAVMHKKSKVKFIKDISSGKHIYDENTKQYWMNKLKISNPEKKIKVLADGRVLNMEEVNVSIIEKGLKIFKKP